MGNRLHKRRGTPRHRLGRADGAPSLPQIKAQAPPLPHVKAQEKPKAVKFQVHIQRKTIDAARLTKCEKHLLRKTVGVMKGTDAPLRNPEEWIIIGLRFGSKQAANDWARNRYPVGSWQVSEV